MVSSSTNSTSPAHVTQASIHHEFIERALPAWLTLATPQRLRRLKVGGAGIPGWIRNASQAEHLSMLNALEASWSSQNDVDKMLMDLQDVRSFAEPVLRQALKEKYGVEDDVRETFLKLYSEVKLSPWGHNFDGGASSRTVSLLDAALHNFSSAEVFLSGSEFISRPDAQGHFDIKKIRSAMSIEQFTALCRELDIGARYKHYLESYLRPTDGLARGVLQHRVIKSQQAALKIALQMALLRKDIGALAYVVVQGMIKGLKGLTLDGIPVRYYHLTMLDTLLKGIVLIAADLDAPYGANRRIIAYVPHDPEHPLKEYPSLVEFSRELTRQLRDTGQASPPAQPSSGLSYQQFFSRFVDHQQRGHFFAALNAQLVRVTQHDKEWGVDLPVWRETPEENPRLRYGVMRFENDTETRFNGDLWVYLYQQQQNKILNDARALVISTTDADRTERWAWVENLQKMLSDIFNVALLVVTPFVPFLGELMLAYTAYQLVSEVVEGVLDLSEGLYLEAAEQLIGFTESVVQLAAFAGGIKIGDLAFSRLSPFIEGAKPVTLATGKQRLWGQNLEPYQQKALVLAADSKPDELWLHQHDGKPILRLDTSHFELKNDPQTGKHRVQHPTRPDAYQPVVESNGAGAFVIEGEQPQSWDEQTLMARMGPPLDGLTDSFDDIRTVSRTHVDAMRRMYIDNEPPLPLLSDTVTRFRIDRDIQAFIDQISSEQPQHYLKADVRTQLQLLDGVWPGERPLQLVARDGSVTWQTGSNDSVPVRINEDRLNDGDLIATLLSHLDEGETKTLMEDVFGASVTTTGAHAKILRAEIARRASAKRNFMFNARYKEHELRWSTQVQAVQSEMPGLPGAVAQELLAVATPEELQIVAQGRLPSRLKGLALYAREEVRVARAYEGLYLASVESFDTETLVLHSLENLPGWPSDVSIQVRLFEYEGGVLDSIGTEHATLKRTIVSRVDGSFQAYDDQGHALHAETDLYSSILQALPDAELTGLNIRRSDVQTLKQAVRDHAVRPDRLSTILAQFPVPIPPAFNPALLRLRGGASNVEGVESDSLNTLEVFKDLVGRAYSSEPLPSVKKDYLNGLKLIHENLSGQDLNYLQWAFHDAVDSPLVTATMRQSVELLPELKKMLSPEQFTELLNNMFMDGEPTPLSDSQRELGMTARYLKRTKRTDQYESLALAAKAGNAPSGTLADLHSYVEMLGEHMSATEKVIEVSSQTMADLNMAQRAITRAKELLPLSGNQLPSIWEKGGSAIAALKNLRKIDLVTGLPTAELTIAEAAQAAINIKGGNCSENSKVTFSILANQPRTSEIHIVKATNFDHQYVVIGDLSHPEQLVAADSWPEFPCAHLTSEGYFTFDPEPVLSLKPGPAVAEYAFIDDAPSGTAVIPPRGSDDSTLRAIKIPKLHQKGGYAQWTSLKELGATYVSPDERAVSFERHNASVIENRLETFEGYYKAISSR
ncbi:MULTISPECIES: dermonecrotic toxin domain-containing protein [Pseudomonas]|uniref:Dermonecrotic toxin N-terminal domain-containing protein n=1 Tax=Pseudomonas fluorescens TaxID=294 RepID=A0A0N9W673_PSEFL|nr:MULTISPECIES: DUF6543 domain-containing protein [Pseudomonas]ALI02043.1 hypothetical protein AO353_13455 [Pseudomonas fluorescens]